MSYDLKIRPATRKDLFAISVLVLTSFRQLPLFSSLYSPLNVNRDYGADTLWFWRRRIQLEMLNPDARVTVAEVDKNVKAMSREDSSEVDEVVKESWEMFEWVTKRYGIVEPQEIPGGKVIVGFAIWWIRRPGIDTEEIARKSWGAMIQEFFIQIELKFRSLCYPRADQDKKAYKAYLQAEEALEEKFHSSERAYYLDNLTVDFRFQRRGIGSALLQDGIQEGQRRGLPIKTEAGPAGESLYYQAGFEKVGEWKVVGMVFPVMRLYAA
jgi:ribosomal protein S18 acetylase RimI-like enzyme